MAAIDSVPCAPVKQGNSLRILPHRFPYSAVDPPAPATELRHRATGGRLATGVLAIGRSGRGGTRHGVPSNGSACNVPVDQGQGPRQPRLGAHARSALVCRPLTDCHSRRRRNPASRSAPPLRKPVPGFMLRCLKGGRLGMRGTAIGREARRRESWRAGRAGPNREHVRREPLSDQITLKASLSQCQRRST